MHADLFQEKSQDENGIQLFSFVLFLDSNGNGQFSFTATCRRLCSSTKSFAHLRSVPCFSRQHHCPSSLFFKNFEMPLPLPLRLGFRENLFRGVHLKLDSFSPLLDVKWPVVADRQTNLLPHPKLYDKRCPFGAISHGGTDNSQ